MLSSNTWPNWSSWANRRRFVGDRPPAKGAGGAASGGARGHPGTLTDAALLDDKTDNRLLALVFQQGVLGIAWLSLASGEFVVQETRAEHCLSELERLRPAEILVADNARLAVLEQVRAPIKRLPPWQFERASASERLAGILPCRIWPALARAVLGPAIGAAGALLEYARATQGSQLPHLDTCGWKPVASTSSWTLPPGAIWS